MRNLRLVRNGLTLTLLAGAASIASAQLSTAPAQGGVLRPDFGSTVPRYTVETGLQRATANNVEFLMPTQRVWKPVCSNKAGMTVADLAKMDVTHAADFADATKVIIVDRQGGNVAPMAGLNMVFSLGASVPAAALPAFAAAEAYLEAQFPNDPVTVTVSVSFAALSSGVIGGTGSSYGSVNWATTRSVLQTGADASDTILASLPSGTTIPVRYSTNSTTNEDRVFWTFANWKAAGGTVTGTDASMQYSTAFPFDFDPSNGVASNTISLQDVIVHETGHALGFGSGVDFRFRDIETLDIFRFRRTDGSGDFNPDTAAEFTVRPRWGVFNNPNDDANFDTIASEFAASDGSPWQASHFREQTPPIGIMDPAFDFGQTFFPNFFRTSDITMFDAIGWDR
jgi:hypothetical protein